MEQEEYQTILNYMNNKSYNQNVSENEKRRIRARSKKFMIEEIDGFQYLYTKNVNPPKMPCPIFFIVPLKKSLLRVFWIHN